ncbi:MAG: hypothetical protein QW567_01985 [Candidatus Hadarchaeales archaeon]
MTSGPKAAKSDVVSDYMTGLELMKRARPKDAIPYLEKVLKANPGHTGARVLLDDAKESLKWTQRYFCTHCGRMFPIAGEPKGKVSEDLQKFCPWCHHRTSLSTQAGRGIKVGTGSLIKGIVSVPLGFLTIILYLMRDSGYAIFGLSYSVPTILGLSYLAFFIGWAPVLGTYRRGAREWAKRAFYAFICAVVWTAILPYICEILTAIGGGTQ